MSLTAKIVLKKALAALKRAKVELTILETDPSREGVATKISEIDYLEDELEVAKLEFELASKASDHSPPSSGSGSSSPLRKGRGRPRKEPIIHWCDWPGCLVSNLPDGTGRSAYNAGALEKHKESRNCLRNYVPCKNCKTLVSTNAKDKHERTCAKKVAEKVAEKDHVEQLMKRIADLEFGAGAVVVGES